MSLPGLPGLGLDEPEETQVVETTQHDLGKENEWRFEVAVGKYAQVKVCSHEYSQIFQSLPDPDDTKFRS